MPFGLWRRKKPPLEPSLSATTSAGKPTLLSRATTDLLPLPRIVGSIIHNKASNDEIPKEVFNSRYALHAVLVHALAIGTTAFLLNLVFSRTYFGDIDMHRANVKLGSLQIAVKIHETLMITSLSFILLDAIRHFLLSDTGVPFGLVVTSYRPQVSILWNPQLWSSFSLFLARKRTSTAFLFLTSVIIMTLCAIVGPASGILMIPRLDKWPCTLRNPGVLGYRIIGNIEDFWPAQVNETHLRTPECLQSNATSNIDCPAWIWTNLGPIFDTLWLRNGDNLTVINPRGNIPGVFEGWSGSAWGIAISHFRSQSFSAQIPTLYRRGRDMFQEYLGQKFDSLQLKSFGGYSIYQPITQGQCKQHTGDSSSIMLPHDNLIVPPLNKAVAETWMASWTGKSEKPRSGKHAVGLALQWLDPKDYDNKFSLGAIVRVESDLPLEILTSDENSWLVNQSVSFYACTIDARWAATSYSIAGGDSSSTQGNWTSALEALQLPDKQHVARLNGSGKFDWSRWSPQGKAAPLKQIFVSKSWAKSLLAGTRNDEPAFIGYLRSAANSDVFPLQISDISDSLAAMLTITISYGMALVTPDPFNFQTYTLSGKKPMMSDMSFPENISTGSTMVADLETLKYGYVFEKNTITANLAVAVLLLQALSAVIHVIWVLWTRNGSTRWNNVGELIALTMNSKPTESLRNTCVAIDRLDTWKSTVRIRDTGVDHLELVFDDDDNGTQKTPSKNKLYGTFPIRD